MLDVEKEWTDRVRTLLRTEMARREISYVELAERLRGLGIEETPKNLSNKIAKGKFSAAFFFQCMAAMGTTVHLDDA